MQELERRRLEVAQQKEFKRREEEAAEQEAARRQAEAQAVANLPELLDMTAIAEGKSALLLQTVKPLRSDTNMNDEEVLILVGKSEALYAETQTAHKACIDFILSRKMNVRNVGQEVPHILHRVGTSSKDAQTTIQVAKTAGQKAQDNKDAAARKAAAKRSQEKQESLWNKYDKDNDGVWGRDDIICYVKEEYAFDMTDERVTKILQDLAPGSNGVPKDKFSRLKVLVGIARDEVRSKQRKIEAERRKKLVEEQTEEMKRQVATAAAGLDGVDAELKNSEVAMQPILTAQIPHAEKLQIADQVDAIHDAVRDLLLAARERCQSFVSSLEVEPEVTALATQESQAPDACR